MFTNAEIATTLLKRSLSRSKERTIFISIEYSNAQKGERYFRVLRGYKYRNTLNTMSCHKTIDDIIDVIASISNFARKKEWENLRVRFNSVSIPEHKRDEAKARKVNLDFNNDEAMAISKALLERNVEDMQLSRIHFSSLKNTPLSTALDFAQASKESAYTDISPKSKATCAKKEIETYIERNNLTNISNAYDESLLCIATSLAYHYYQSDDAVDWLFNTFGERQVVMSKMSSIADTVLEKIEHHLEDWRFSVISLMGGRWLIRRDNVEVIPSVINKDTESLTSYAEAYIKQYVVDNAELLKNIKEGKSLAFFINRMATHNSPNLKSNTNAYECLNLLNLNLIKYFFEHYIDIDEVNIEWMESFLRCVKREEEFETRHILEKRELPITAMGCSYKSIREYIISLKPITTDPIEHFNPLRMALIQAISSRERDSEIANKLLKKYSKEQVGKHLLYTDDVIAFIKYYEIDPVDAISYIPDPELQAFSLSLLSQ